MHESFAPIIGALHEKYLQLVACPIIKEAKFPKPMPKQGVYLFSENDIPLYVGRSNRLRGRYGSHSNKGSRHTAAAFAMRLAREATGKQIASYISGKDDRKTLIQDVLFKEAFEKAKIRIRNMDYRFVEETDQVRQALLEIYCAVVLKTPYNDFTTH